MLSVQIPRTDFADRQRSRQGEGVGFTLCLTRAESDPQKARRLSQLFFQGFKLYLFFQLNQQKGFIPDEA